MKASYKILNTPDNLIAMGTKKFYVSFMYDGFSNYEYERRAKTFYDNLKDANSAGKRYLKKMEKEGYEITE